MNEEHSLSKGPTTRSYNIQVVRGVAIVAVVCLHNLPGGNAQIFLRPFVNFAVGTFLFLSGMLSSVENYHPAKRIKKVIVPYLVWSLIYIIIYNYNNVGMIPIRYLKTVAIARAASIMYYIFVYIELTLLIPAIDKLAKSKFKYWGFLISPCEIIFVRLIPLIVGYEINNFILIISRISCLGWFTYFYLGYLLGNGYLQIKISRIKLISLWVISILLQIAEAYYYYVLGDNDCGQQLKLTCILTGVLANLIIFNKLGSRRRYEIKYLKTLGDNSFGIYFCHMAIMAILNISLPYYKSASPFPLNAIITLALSSAFIWGGRKLLRKNSSVLAL